MLRSEFLSVGQWRWPACADVSKHDHSPTERTYCKCCEEAVKTTERYEVNFGAANTGQSDC